MENLAGWHCARERTFQSPQALHRGAEAILQSDTTSTTQAVADIYSKVLRGRPSHMDKVVNRRRSQANRVIVAKLGAQLGALLRLSLIRCRLKSLKGTFAQSVFQRHSRQYDGEELW